MLKYRRSLVLLSIIVICENVQFNLYDTELVSDTSADHDCIYYYARKRVETIYNLGQAPIFLVHQLIPYCVRSIGTNKSEFNPLSSIFTFSVLRSQHISSYQLYTWSAPIDVAEEYECYLSNLADNNELSLFHNCTLPWFGVFCQYTFDFGINYFIADIVEATFRAREEHQNQIHNLSCYDHLECIRGPHPICLDWREICDGYTDCSDGIDEVDCWKMEMSNCEEHEYQCHNGQCIPEEYLLDDLWNPECIDNTDELVINLPLLKCITDPAMRCEDHMCPPLRHASSFACGDGQCVQANQIVNHQCQNGRDLLWAKSLVDHTIKILPDLCVMVMVCITEIVPSIMYNIDCVQFCQPDGCRNISNTFCPSSFEFPMFPVVFGHIYFVYAKDELKYNLRDRNPPNYVCYDEQLCIDFLPQTNHINGRTCRRYNETVLSDYAHLLSNHWQAVILEVKYTFEACLSTHKLSYEQFHIRSDIYHCVNSSKFVSKHRLVDGRRDCYANDDEIADACTIKSEYRFKCYSKYKNSNITLCILPFRMIDGSRTCPNEEDNRVNQLTYSFIRPHISLIDFKNFWSHFEIEQYNFFPKICNGVNQFKPILIDEKNYTDETECENWPCNNIYSECDGFWSCKNGLDELNCRPSKCPYLHHPCVSPKTLKLGCLPIAEAGNGFIDCLGATDELKSCQLGSSTVNYFRCNNIISDTCLRSYSLCNKKNDCFFGDDEKFCQHYVTGQIPLCQNSHNFTLSEEEEFICSLYNASLQTKKYFTISNYTKYILVESEKSIPIENIRSLKVNSNWIKLCKRGLPVRVFRKDNVTYIKCLCPPAYYGKTCEYQNQRISLTIQIRTISYWKTMFTIVFLLINNEDEIIESFDQIEFISIKDCGIKYHVNLLYSTRPKDRLKNYSIRIDVFDRHSMTYRGTWNYPIIFSFLPVYPLAIILIIPAHQVISMCENLNCGSHGQCLRYINSDKPFCRCNDGWSGKGCMTTSSTKFTCAPKSLNIGMAHNRSICVCPLGKFGSRCYLKYPSCPDNICEHGSTCIVTDQRIPNPKYICICKEGYSGINCEIEDVKIDLSLEELPIPSAILIHFITAHNDKPESRVTTFGKIPVDQTSTIISISSVFHLVFVEFFNNLYFTHLQFIHTSGSTIRKTIKPSDRCPSIDELFHVNITQLHQLRRIKHYPIICQEYSNLLCFYDDTYICYCYNNGTPNCFIFKHNMTYDCQGFNYCQNSGKCFQNDLVCPTSSMCECEECFYGSRCQFSSKGFGFSLDLILGSHIRPNNYSFFVQISTGIVLLLTILGFINGILSILTFQTKKSRESASGFYLLISSITSILITILFSLKFWFLIFSQKMIITNRSVLFLQCLLIDFFLRIFLNMELWLNACVSLERVIIVIKGIQFNNEKSKYVAKVIVIILLLLNIVTAIHDPISRRLVDDDDGKGKRIWCIVEYSPLLQIFNSLFYLFHFLTPFMINVISALIIMIKLSQKGNVPRSHQNNFRKQLNEHKHLLISPIVLVILSLPQLIISLLPGCMKSFREPWLFLMGYFLSFIQALVSFITFVLPSNIYKKEFLFACRRLKQLFRRTN
ncbi:unnamed protein product [Adineta steineri]|uniref:Uncharacterized protein n=1 Tax=Adineta steineri TaxID=433720 RepID=A0A819S1M9_9BILA|nr:unnamed protein product [Adineta steineri]CAF4054443.1 unnamed protein product [Adineta steineri]